MQETPVRFLGVRKIPWRKSRLPTPVFLDFTGGSAGKESTCNVGDLGSIPGLGRSPGEGKGYPLQYSGLENSMDCTVREVTESNTTERLSLSHPLSDLFQCKIQSLAIFFFILSIYPGKKALPCQYHLHVVHISLLTSSPVQT